jgi:hypothetical protein
VYNSVAIDPADSAYVIEFPVDISGTLLGPACTGNVDGVNCVYYPDSNSIIIIPDAKTPN